MKNQKIRKTLLIVTLSLATVCTNVFCGSAFVKAEENIRQSAAVPEESAQEEGNEWTEDSQEWTIDADGTLTITGTGDLSTYYWNDYDTKKYDVKKIVVNVTGITYFLFDNDDFPNLESIDLSGCDGSQVTDLSNSFSQLTKLKTINFGNFNTGNVTDMSRMFSGCSSLTSLDLSKWNTDNVIDMGYMFDGCSKLSNLNLGSFNTASVIKMNSMFSGCNSLSDIDLKNWNTGNVRDMSWMFSGCVGLNSLDLSNWNTGKVLNMSYLFSGCRNLTSLNLNGLQTGSVTDMDGMFQECNRLKEIDISHFDLSDIELSREDTGETLPIYLFGQADNLVKITVPANLPERITFPYSDTIPDNMIEYWKDASGAECEYVKQGLPQKMTYTRALREIYVPGSSQNQNTPKPLPAGTGITDTASNGRYTVTGANTTVYTGMGNPYAKTVKIPASVTYLGITYKVTAVNAKALRGNKNVTAVIIDGGVTKIGDSAFENCSKLKKVTIGNGVDSIGKSAFKGCKNLKNIQIKSMNLKSVGKNAFKKINKKCKIKVPSSKWKAYQKKLKGKGQAKSVKITK